MCGLYHLQKKAVEQRKLSHCHLLKLHSALPSLALETLTDFQPCSHLTSGETTVQRLSGNFKVKYIATASPWEPGPDLRDVTLHEH